MRYKIAEAVDEYHPTGNCVINIDAVEHLWGPLWWISQWKNTYRLIKYVRRDSPRTAIKVGMSSKQARELIDRLGLVETESGFPSASSWRKPEQKPETDT